MESRNIEIYLPGSPVRSSAYICLAAILAVFMVAFAVAPKVKTQTASESGSWRTMAEDRWLIVVADDRHMTSR
jgi:hypothetical protein